MSNIILDSIATSILPVGGLPNHHYWERDEFYCEVQNQLDCCRGWHKSCPPIGTPILPTRVIDVEDENLPEQVKLHISAEGETASYTALSYCWGGDQRIKTTKDSLTSRIAGLELRSLPQTIQDAAIITRGLKIRYLWIDVLCIIQDDEKDKKTEIENMGRTYKSASLTISAATAKTAEEGFLRVPEARIPIYSPSGDIAVALLTLPKEPIADRAWTFQEQVLSPCILHFGNYRGVLFNCSTGTYRYDGHKFNHTGTIDFLGALPHTVFTQRKSRRSLGKNWAEIITYYSKRRITNSEDRLPALAGIAKEFHKICGSNYWAGMWEKFSIRHLGWRARVTPSRALLRIKLEQIQRPTWSWVSLMDKQLEEPNHIRIEVDEVMEENAKVIKWPVLEDQKIDFGQTTGGRLILQGKLATFLTPPRAVPDPTRWEIGENWGVSIYYEIGDEVTEADYRYFLLGFTAWKSAVGLVLVPDKHDEDGAFLRIGQFRISAKAGEKYSWGIETREIIIV